MKSKNPITELKRICRKGELNCLAEQYIHSCICVDGEQESKRSFKRFPNIAGFARVLGIGVGDFIIVEQGWPEQYGAMLALFEDEALNSDKNATVLNTYIKERLKLGEKKEGGATLPVGDVKIVFEHDIAEDGA